MSQIMTGARGVVKIAGKVVGFISGVDVNVENTLSEADVMGQLEAGDLAETGHKCDFSIKVFKVVNDPSKATAAEATGNAATDIGIDTSSQAAGVATMRNQAYFDVEITDDVSDKTIFYMQDAKFAGGSGQVDARGLWTGSWKFQARKGYGL